MGGLREQIKKWLRRDDGVNVLFRNVWSERKLLITAVAFSGVGAVLEGLGIGLLVPFLQNFTDPEAPGFRTGIEFVDVYLLGVNEDQINRLYRISGLILVSVWLRAMCGYLARFYTTKTTEAILHRLRMQIFDQMQSVALSFYKKTRTGDIINALTGEIYRLRFVFGVISQMLVVGFMIAAYVVMLFILSWHLALISILFSVALLIGLSRMIDKIRSFGSSISEATAQLATSATEAISGARTILSSGTQDYERERFGSASKDVGVATVEAGRRYSRIEPLSQAIASTGLLAMVIVATQFLVLQGTLDVAILLVFLFALFRMLPLVQQINAARGQWAHSRGALDTITQFLARDDKPYTRDGVIPIQSFKDHIVFEDVGFEYEPGKPVLQDINLRISRGTTTALIGASGAGKSTLVDLLPRFHDPMAGRILIDGRNIQDYRLADLRRLMGIVSQDTFLFHDTVFRNISYGLSDVTETRVYEAAEQANALEFILEMPEGFSTVLGERGVRLSGGQRQRIAIARAILRNPQILILDEATSALDSVTERLVQQSLEYLMKGRTVIVIAHRLSTVENADWVAVLEEGRIVEQGSYEDLLEEKGQLWKYHSLQFQLS